MACSKEQQERLAKDRGTKHQRLGMWLAKKALLLTGNRDLASIASALPLIAERRWMISVEPVDLSSTGILSKEHWIYWERQAPAQPPRFLEPQ